MDTELASKLLGALGNNTRLAIFRALIQAGDIGINPRILSKKFNLKPNKLSFHLNCLKELNLILDHKQGREIKYSANYKIMDGLTKFLFENCCQGQKKC